MPLARMENQPPGEQELRVITDTMPVAAVREIQPFVDRIVAGEQVAYERLVELPGLGRRWVKWAYTPTHDAAGRVDGWVATGMDIHAAKEADRRKDEFLATLAHELRGPLAPIRNAAEILASPRAGAGELVRTRN